MTTKTNERLENMFFHKILTKLNDTNKEILNEFAEPSIIITLINWSIGQSDLPFGILTTREDCEYLSAEDADGCLEQLRKMSSYIYSTFKENKLIQIINEMKEMLEDKENTIKELQNKIKEMQKSVNESK